MRTLIAIPAFDTVQTLFMTSLLSLRKPEGTNIKVCTGSLVYDARNTLAMEAIRGGYDRILWLDSDMVFDPDMMERLNADLDTGLDCVCAAYFTRKAPVRPVVYKALDVVDGVPTNTPVDTIPEEIFEVAGMGFGAVMMRIGVFHAMGDLRPFSPLPGWGEDLSFCLRMREKGFRMWCDGRVNVGHLGISIIDASTWAGAQKEGDRP